MQAEALKKIQSENDSYESFIEFQQNAVKFRTLFFYQREFTYFSLKKISSTTLTKTSFCVTFIFVSVITSCKFLSAINCAGHNQTVSVETLYSKCNPDKFEVKAMADQFQ
jgi:hypothetical protein